MRRTSESLKLVLYQFSDYIFVIDNLNVIAWEKFQVSIKNLSVKKCFITISKDYVLLENDIYILCANVLLTKGVLHLHSSFVLYKDKALVLIISPQAQALPILPGLVLAQQLHRFPGQ